MGRKAVEMGLRRWTLPFHISGLTYEPFEWNDKVEAVSVEGWDRFITVHDGFDASGHLTFERSTKSWDLDYWNEFVRLFKEKHPDIGVIQLGGIRHRKIQYVDLNLAGQIPFHESLRYLKSATLHVDGDSGLVHARRLFHKPSVVMFGPTNYEYFAYPENINIKAPICGDCWWQKPNWMEHCVLGFLEPSCMQSISPQHVLSLASFHPYD